jgi:hypothetical protein
LKRRRDSDFENNFVIMKRETYLKIFLENFFLARCPCAGI